MCISALSNNKKGAADAAPFFGNKKSRKSLFFVHKYVYVSNFLTNYLQHPLLTSCNEADIIRHEEGVVGAIIRGTGQHTEGVPLWPDLK